MLYFAYGSNMNWDQMRERCPSSRFLGIAALPDHRLAFTRGSPKRGCGVADVVAEARKSIWVWCMRLPISISASSTRRRASRRDEPRMRTIGVSARSISMETSAHSLCPPTSLSHSPIHRFQTLLTRMSSSRAGHWHLPAVYIRELEQILVSA